MTHIKASKRIAAAVAAGRISGTVWLFQTKRFTVSLEIAQTPYFEYDGDDEAGETQAAIDSGEMVAFDSRVIVELDGEEITGDSLCGSVYYADKVAEFWTAHRDRDPMNRNCSVMRAQHGGNVSICHYFPSMVAEAIKAARDAVAGRPDKPALRGTQATAQAVEPQPATTEPETVESVPAVVPVRWRPLFEAMATACDSRLRCARDLDDIAAGRSVLHESFHPLRSEWFDRWTERLENWTREWMPHGSGFDSGTTFDFERSTGDRLIFNTAFHHMDENGCYDGWTEHSVTVRPSLFLRFTLSISGRNRREIKEYIGEIFHDALSREIDD